MQFALKYLKNFFLLYSELKMRRVVAAETWTLFIHEPFDTLNLINNFNPKKL